MYSRSRTGKDETFAFQRAKKVAPGWWKGKISNVGAGPEKAAWEALAGRWASENQQLRWVQTPRRARPSLRGASVFLPEEVARGAEPRTPTPGQRPLFPPCGPLGWSQMPTQRRVGKRHRGRNSPSNFSQRLLKPQQPPLSQPKLRSERSPGPLSLGEGDSWGRIPGACGCSPCSTGSRSHSHEKRRSTPSPQTMSLSSWASSPFLGECSAGVCPAMLSSEGERDDVPQTLHLGSPAGFHQSHASEMPSVVWEDEVPPHHPFLLFEKTKSSPQVRN